MKRFFGILMMVIAMMTVTTSVCAQAPNQKQRLSREQLAEKQAKVIEEGHLYIATPPLYKCTYRSKVSEYCYTEQQRQAFIDKYGDLFSITGVTYFKKQYKKQVPAFFGTRDLKP